MCLAKPAGYNFKKFAKLFPGIVYLQVGLLENENEIYIVLKPF